MNFQSQHNDQTIPTSRYQLYGDASNPYTFVMLKDIRQMGYLNPQYMDDRISQPAPKSFPNYYILNNLKISHKQKVVLYTMINQPTCRKIMVDQFCRLARKYFPEDKDLKHIQELEEEFKSKEIVKVVDIFRWYTRETFFYRLLNRLLRGGKDSTQLYYGQYFVRLLSCAIRAIYEKNKNKKQPKETLKFSCYRGAYFSKEQIQQLEQNVGKHIQTLGFLSTSLQKSVAENFMGNSLIEIEVSNTAKDDKFDFGFAFLSEELSIKPDQLEVLFNVLSSFQIKSVERQGDTNYIKLEYGVTYQMVKKYKQNKLSLERDSVEYQQILAILSYQQIFSCRNRQEWALVRQGLLNQYIQLKKAKISIWKNTPQLQSKARVQQMRLYYYLKTDEQFKGKQQQFIQQMQQFLKNYKKQTNRQGYPLNTLFDNLKITLLYINLQFLNANYRQTLQFINLWRQQKIYLQSNADFQSLLDTNPQYRQDLEQWQLQLTVMEIISKIYLYFEKEDNISLIQWLKTAEKLLPKLLEKQGRYSQWYGRLSGEYVSYGYKIGLTKYEAYLQRLQEEVIRRKGVDLNSANSWQTKIIKVWKQANKHIGRKEWVEAVGVCAQFRDKEYKGKQNQDRVCFQPIKIYFNKDSTLVEEKLQILEVCLNVKHPKQSVFGRLVEITQKYYRKQQEQKNKKTSAQSITGYSQ